MEIRPAEFTSHGLGVSVVAVRQLFCGRPAVSRPGPGQQIAPRAEDAGVLRPHGDQNRIPERVPYLQSRVRHTHTHTLELVFVLCHKLRDRVRHGQLGVQLAGPTQLVPFQAVHLLFLLVHAHAHDHR